MPHDYDPQRKRFVKNGETTDPKEVRALIDKLTETVKKDAKRIAKRYETNKITLAQFKKEMQDLLRSGHIVAASVGKGGRERMTQRDWGKVGAKIKWQYGYLDKFVKKIEQGRISKILTANRAQAYASALHITYYQSNATENKPDKPLVRRVLNAKESCDGCSQYAAMGWIPVDEMPELGELECGDFCKCDLVFRDDDEQS